MCPAGPKGSNKDITDSKKVLDALKNDLGLRSSQKESQAQDLKLQTVTKDCFWSWTPKRPKKSKKDFTDSKRVLDGSN